MKKLLAVLFALLTLLCLAGCENGNSSDTTTTTGDAVTTTTGNAVTTTTLGDGTTTLEDVTTTTTTKATTTTVALITTTKATTTTVAPITTTKATTTTVATTTTTAATYSAFESSDWMFRMIKAQNNIPSCHTYTLVLDKDNLCCGEAIAGPYEEMVPPEYRDEEKPDFEFGGIQWIVGAGDAMPLSSVTVSGNTITLTETEGKKLVLLRTSETTATVVSNTIDIPVKAGDVFTAVK